ncbi:hypothetical protein D3C81_1693760 [compost metagenome]
MQIGQVEPVELLNQVTVGRHDVAVGRRVTRIGCHWRKADANPVTAPDRNYGFGDFKRQSSPVLDRTAIAVSALIGGIAQKLVEQIAVGRMDFHTIKTGSLCIFCRMPVLLDDPRDL